MFLNTMGRGGLFVKFSRGVVSSFDNADEDEYESGRAMSMITMAVPIMLTVAVQMMMPKVVTMIMSLMVVNILVIMARMKMRIKCI